MKKKITAAVLAAAMTAALLSGCGNKEEAAEASAAVSSVSEASVVSEASSVSEVSEVSAVSASSEEEGLLAVIGVQEDGAEEIRLKNSTGRDITGLSISVYGEPEFYDNLLKEGEPFKNGEERLLCYKVPEKTETAAADGPQVEPEYLVQLVFDDGVSRIVHNFPMEDAKDCEIFADDTLACIVYESKSTHETVNTWNAEANILAMAEEAARQAEAEAQRQAEAEAAAEAQRQAEEAAAAAAAAAAEQGGQQNTDADGCIPDDEEIFN